MSSSPNTTTPSERTLPARYEIRPLGPEHAPWATAIVCHSNAFHSTVFPVVYPERVAARFNAALKAAGYLVDHQIKSGLSYGVFDKEYPFRRPESASAPAGGRFYWDPEEEGNEEMTAEEVLERMDFPLVSVALAYDGFDKMDFQQCVLFCFFFLLPSFLPPFSKGFVLGLLTSLDCYLRTYAPTHLPNLQPNKKQAQTPHRRPPRLRHRLQAPQRARPARPVDLARAGRAQHAAHAQRDQHAARVRGPGPHGAARAAPHAGGGGAGVPDGQHRVPERRGHARVGAPAGAVPRGGGGAVPHGGVPGGGRGHGAGGEPVLPGEAGGYEGVHDACVRREGGGEEGREEVWVGG